MNGVPDVLKRILADKADEVMARSRQLPLAQLRARLGSAPAVRGFRAALRRRVKSGRPGVIAEIKQASPSKGLLREHLDVGAIAASYAENGASCISVLTDEKHFRGRSEYLAQARAACELPLLRKDFMIDPWQVYESRLLGADCILLIVAALGDPVLGELAGLAAEIGMDALIEVHDENELARALELKPALIGINNRDLRSFHTDTHTTIRLLQKIPAGTLVVTESGVGSREDVTRLCHAGVQAFLVGEAFMRAPDPGVKLAELFADQILV